MKITSLLATLVFIAAASAMAAEKMDWKACEKEIKQFSCAGDDKSIWSCLEKHDDKLSPACQKVHEQGDSKFKK
jgi:hypothetical protein